MMFVNRMNIEYCLTLLRFLHIIELRWSERLRAKEMQGSWCHFCVETTCHGASLAVTRLALVVVDVYV